MLFLNIKFTISYVKLNLQIPVIYDKISVNKKGGGIMEFRNSDQLKAFLKKEARRLNINYNSVYTTFFARDFLSRLSKNDCNCILVKGSSAEIAYLGRLARAITDIDFASMEQYDDFKHIIVRMMTDNTTSQIDYKLIRDAQRTKTGIIQLSISGMFGTIKQPLGIDIEENYHRLIKPEIRMMPAIFDEDKPFPIYTPSFEEYLSEKLCIIIESNNPALLNTRVKDFYDIYQLHGGKYDADKLTEYFGKMIALRGKITLEEADTRLLNPDFIASHSAIWESTKERYGFLDKEIDLAGAVYYTRGVLREQLQKNNVDMRDNISGQISKNMQLMKIQK